MTLAELYQEAARVAKMIEETPLSIDNCIKFEGSTLYSIDEEFMPVAHDGNKYEFALALIDDIPVFKGDFVFSKDYPNGIEAEHAQYLYNLTGLKSFSLTKPKPKTVMVELLREDAEDLAKFQISLARQAAACKKALEE